MTISTVVDTDSVLLFQCFFNSVTANNYRQVPAYGHMYSSGYRQCFIISVLRPVTVEMMSPLVALLKSRDPEVQRIASLALSNFALNGPGENIKTTCL